ncbi:MAG: hypothetical protein JW974_02660 [Alphaproteobacteria bacterium]|jgi:hypothetical protein|nr:hypothetical protein [Alphaproteobacteria bacterium]MBN2675553.1 hypothetical protein [Alphaproteobacteria bacterium]
MNEDEKMFKWGLGLAMFVLMLTAALQVCYRTQNRARNNVHKEIVKIQQEIAIADANFSSYVGNEFLRNLVTTIYPKVEVITFNKSVTAAELPNKE